MTVSEIIKQVVETKGAVLIRDRKESHVKGTAWHYDVKPLFTGNKKGWIILDLFTASAMLAVYKALSENNQARFDYLHVKTLVDFTWKHVK